jgi:dipeptidyl aminopeptidase/acylaminoacyl peptidase
MRASGRGPTRAVVSAAALLCLLATAAGAEAAFPGQPGKIAFQSTRAGGLSIWLVNPDGSGLHQFTSGDGNRQPRLRQFSPTISADGRRIAYVASQEIGERTWHNVFVKGIGVRDRQRPGRKVLRRPLPSAINSVAFFPSGRRLVFSAIVHRRGGPDFELFAIGVDGRGLRQLTFNPIQDAEPTVSSNGLIAFAQVNATGTPRFGVPAGPSDIAVLRPSWPASRLVTRGPAEDREPSFSPDGRRIAYGRRSANDRTEIAEITLGSDRSRLVRRGEERDGGSEYVGSPAFSPTGDRIAFDSTRYNFFEEPSFNADVFEIPLDGSGMRRITGLADHYDTEPDWGPAPRRGR